MPCAQEITDGQIILFLVVAVLAAVGMFGAGYWAGSSDSTPYARRADRSEEPPLPDPRKFRPPPKR